MPRHAHNLRSHRPRNPSGRRARAGAVAARSPAVAVAARAGRETPSGGPYAWARPAVEPRATIEAADIAR